jgi:hypothetical protein
MKSAAGHQTQTVCRIDGQGHPLRNRRGPGPTEPEEAPHVGSPSHGGGSNSYGGPKGGPKGGSYTVYKETLVL